MVSVIVYSAPLVCYALFMPNLLCFAVFYLSDTVVDDEVTLAVKIIVVRKVACMDRAWIIATNSPNTVLIFWGKGGRPYWRVFYALRL